MLFLAKLLALIFDVIALLFVFFAGYGLLHQYYVSPKEKKFHALTDKAYTQLRKHFVHRIIISLDLFIVADLLKLVVLSTTEGLIQLLLVVIIRTIVSHFLLEGNK